MADEAETNVREILHGFVDNHDVHRGWLSRLHVHDGWVYATDGRIAVRAPCDGDDDADPNVKPLFGWFDQPMPLVRLPTDLVPKESVDDCNQCYDGFVYDCECPNCDGHECQTCNGTGKINEKQFVKVGSVVLSGDKLRQIARLPDVEISHETNARGHIMFRSGCIEGLCMPARVDRPTHVLGEPEKAA